MDRNVNLRVVDGSMSSVALRKESVDRNSDALEHLRSADVALRKESVDRNSCFLIGCINRAVALRKESVDRNTKTVALEDPESESLSARRAWIEIPAKIKTQCKCHVALRKESVDRNNAAF